MASPAEENQEPEREELDTEQNEDEDGGEVETEEEGTEEEEEEEKEEEEEEEGEGGGPSEKERMADILRRLSTHPVGLRVHDVVIKGNTRTRESLIEAEVMEVFRSASTMREVVQAASVAAARLRRLDVFDSVAITLDAGPRELPGTTNVVIEVVEAKNSLTGDVGIFTKPEVFIKVLLQREGSNKCWEASIFGQGK